MPEDVVIPRYKHFTSDPLKPIGDDQERVPSSMSMDNDDPDRVKQLSDADRGAYEERLERQRDEWEQRARSDEPGPKPSELLEQRGVPGAEPTQEPAASPSNEPVDLSKPPREQPQQQQQQPQQQQKSSKA